MSESPKSLEEFLATLKLAGNENTSSSDLSLNYQRAFSMGWSAGYRQATEESYPELGNVAQAHVQDAFDKRDNS